MKPSERIETLKRISCEISNRYNFAEARSYIAAYIHGYRVDFDDFIDVKEMAFFALDGARDSILAEIIDDLGIESHAHIAMRAQPPEMWSDSSQFRVFISHISKDKKMATRLKEALLPYGAVGFVAHEDIAPTLEWQVQIERALHAMDLFISLHTPGYEKSVWAQQEIGFAVGSGAKIIALRMGEDPTGFISKHQAISRGSKKAEDVAAEIDKLLQKDDRTKERYALAQKLTPDDDVPF